MSPSILVYEEEWTHHISPSIPVYEEEWTCHISICILIYEEEWSYQIVGVGSTHPFIFRHRKALPLLIETALRCRCWAESWGQGSVQCFSCNMYELDFFTLLERLPDIRVELICYLICRLPGSNSATKGLAALYWQIGSSVEKLVALSRELPRDG